VTYFLEEISRILYEEFGNTLNRHCLVFQNRRAGLYFMKYLAEKISKPIWSPSIVTINELFRLNSDLQVAGNEVLLFELYKVYRNTRKNAESFDDFYFWGDMLLNDFDDIDKYLADASVLFRNVKDLKNIDQQFGTLSPEQYEIVKRFWTNFEPEKWTDEKIGFISVWSTLIDVYSGFKIALKDQNIAYEGMIFREVAEKSRTKLPVEDRYDMFHFIGFNALNECEKTIMKKLKKENKARFYWDYDNSYLTGSKLNSAGFFLKDNLRIFGNDMPVGWDYNTFVSSDNGIIKHRIIETSSDVAQVKIVPQLIESIPDLDESNAHHTAIVLADENLLMPLLSSLPQKISGINITMGHPLRQTMVYTFLKQLMDLQSNTIVENGVVRFRYNEVISVLKNPLVSILITEPINKLIDDIIAKNIIWVLPDIFAENDYLSKIFVKPPTPLLLSEYIKEILSAIVSSGSNIETGAETESESVYNSADNNIRNEFIYNIILSVNRLGSIINKQEINFTTSTFIRILDKLLKNLSVPFSGEPLLGIQIMGILETRALDFRNLIFLSVNEGVLPAVSSGASFIPFTLREAFGLPSINHQESVYSYHFYHLLQRAENIIFTYNSNSEGLRSGEMSRFLIQMKYEMAVKPQFIDLNFEIRSHNTLKESIERREEHMVQLSSLYLDKNTRKILSPSAINTWLSCRMKFYYRYVNMLKEPERVSADIDPAMFGIILHDLMKTLYKDYIGEIIDKENFLSFLRRENDLRDIIDLTIKNVFSNGEYDHSDGNILIIKEVLLLYLKKIINEDLNNAPLSVIGLEDSYSFFMPLVPEEDGAGILTGGQVDRIDKTQGVVRIVDYKTGAVAESIYSVDDLFVEDRKKDYDGWLQTLLYCEAFLSKKPGIVICPSIYKIRKLGNDKVNDMLRIKTDARNSILVNDYSIIRDTFLDGLKGLITRMMDKSEPFTMTADKNGKCPYCPYKALCMRCK
jgi:hypothetical protein